MGENRNHSLIRSLHGFTLVELSIVILIAGILMLPLIQMYDSYVVRKKLIVTKENVQDAVNGLSLVLNRFPCPSDRSIPPGAPNHGIEQCDLASIPLCTTAGLQGICRATSTFDRDGDLVNDDIIIGGVPLNYYGSYVAGVPQPLSITRVAFMDGTKILDGWGNQLTYAVVASITQPNRDAPVIQRDYKAGVISARDENNNPTAGINDNALFVVFSHGQDGRGAFNYHAVPFDNCPTTARGENCDEDTTFMQGIALSDGTDPFDDISKFYIMPEGELWRPTGELDPLNRPLPHIRNMNSDNVGVNLSSSPTNKLEVGGTIRADSVRTNNICDETGSNCFSAATIFGTGMPITAGTGSAGVCGTGEIVIGISNGSMQCGYPTFNAVDTAGHPVTTGTRTCPVGRYVTSVLTNSCIICSDGSKVCS